MTYFMYFSVCVFIYVCMCVCEDFDGLLERVLVFVQSRRFRDFFCKMCVP